MQKQCVGASPWRKGRPYTVLQLSFPFPSQLLHMFHLKPAILPFSSYIFGWTGYQNCSFHKRNVILSLDILPPCTILIGVYTKTNLLRS